MLIQDGFGPPFIPDWFLLVQSWKTRLCILFSANFITVLLVMDFVANFIQANAF